MNELHARVARSLALDRMAVEVVDLLEAAGVRRPVLLKGASVAGWLYPKDGARDYVDVDLLVHPSDAEAARGALREAGYHRRPGAPRHDRSSHAEEWDRADLPGELDLHTTIVGCGLGRAPTVELLQHRTERLGLAGRDVLVLDEPARALHVVLHAAQDRLQHDKKLEDLRRLLALEDLSWDEVVALAGRLRALPALRAGLELVPEGRRLAGDLDLPDVGDTETRLRAAGHGPAPVRLEHLQKVPTWGGRLRYLAELCWPRRAVVDPSGDHGLAWSVVARLRRLARVAGALPRTVLTWWRARRASR